ncbi:uncharacterized protein MYCFIDRAFT_179277 [Pseudocercospora fijiensis CIRAD86]|uniref:Uncharacterized protein n=1 Tax=Pseudocercospora fijiensis (strain CIRAD86) TaxID=383855 RepID=M3AK19_PSEFD|nr:uncharacterized protein MYCFIDRAFT_179277 [Pseudocercospora fijiensis CIRAD86]EME77787.1 hypothetical protein MYCFIDRAFT_179277 [Pseudocercospora fijiensis CIRAD86]
MVHNYFDFTRHPRIVIDQGVRIPDPIRYDFHGSPHFLHEVDFTRPSLQR